MTDNRPAWALPTEPVAPMGTNLKRIVVAYPRPSILFTLRPLEALVWDVVGRGKREYIDIVPGQFLGLPVAVLDEALSNLAGLHLLSAEGIEPTRRTFDYSAETKQYFEVKEAVDRKQSDHDLGAEQAKVLPGPAHTPWGLPDTLPLVR